MIRRLLPFQFAEQTRTWFRRLMAKAFNGNKLKPVFLHPNAVELFQPRMLRYTLGPRDPPEQPS